VSRTRLCAASLCECHGARQRRRRDRDREGGLAVDEDHGEIDPVAPFELFVTVDRNAAQVEAELRRGAFEHGQRASAEAAAGGLVEDHLDGVNPRR
jgi:hypothetical protein